MYHQSAFLAAGVPVFEIRAGGGHDEHARRDRAARPRRSRRRSPTSPRVLMRGHGAVVIADSIPNVVGRSIYLDLNARIQAQAIALGGKITYIDPEEARKYAASDNYSRAWELWKRKASGSGRRSVRLQPTDSDADICYTSGRELAALIRARKISAREVMAAHLERINRLNPTLNAIVAKLDDDECLALADEADRSSREATTVGPAARPAVGVQGSRRRRRLSLHIRIADLQGPHAGGGQPARRAAAPRGRRSDRQDERAGVRHGLAHVQQRLRHDGQSVRRDEDAPAARAAAPARRSRPGCCRSPTAATSADPCAIRPTSTTSSRCGRRPASRRRRATRRRSGSTSKGRWPGPWTTSRFCSA